MNEDRLRSLAGAEVMTWRVDALPFTVAETDGPLVVKLKGEVVKMFRWFHHPRFDRGRLLICDATHDLRIVAEYEPGRWDECIHDWRYAGLY